MVSKVAQISKLAKKIRHKGENWQGAIKRASKQLNGTKPKAAARPGAGHGKKSAPSKRKKKAAKKAYKPRKPVHQTGHSSELMDKRIKAKAPGRRKVKTSKGSHTYYEYRKNRSDMPGKMTGISAYNEMILGRMRDNNYTLSAAERELLQLEQSRRNSKDSVLKRSITASIKRQKKYISTIKADNRMLKSLLR